MKCVLFHYCRAYKFPNKDQNFMFDKIGWLISGVCCSFNVAFFDKSDVHNF